MWLYSKTGCGFFENCDRNVPENLGCTLECFRHVGTRHSDKEIHTIPLNLVHETGLHSLVRGRNAMDIETSIERGWMYAAELERDGRPMSESDLRSAISLNLTRVPIDLHRECYVCRGGYSSPYEYSGEPDATSLNAMGLACVQDAPDEIVMLLIPDPPTPADLWASKGRQLITRTIIRKGIDLDGPALRPRPPSWGMLSGDADWTLLTQALEEATGSEDLSLTAEQDMTASVEFARVLLEERERLRSAH